MITVVMYAFAAGVIGLVPGSAPFLILLEIGMIYHLSVKNNRPFNLAELGIIVTLLLATGGPLQGLVGSAFDFLPILGWFAKAALAFIFVICFGAAVNKYYQIESKRNPK